MRIVNFMAALLAALMLLLPVAYAAENPPLQLTAATRHVSLDGHVASYIDAQGTLPFESAARAEYTPLKEFRSAGYTSAAYWYRFTLARDGNAPQDWILAMGEPNLDDIHVWLVSADNQVREYRLGDHIEYAERPLQTRMQALRFGLPDGRPVTVYVRVQSISALIFNAAVWQPDAFVAGETSSNFYHGIYFGVLGVIIVVNLLFGTWLRDSGMLAYAGYVSSIFLSYVGINGYEPIMFATGSAWITDALPGIGTLGSIIAAAVMWILLLDMKQQYPRIYRLYLAIIVFSICLLSFVGTQYFRITAPLAFKAGIIIAVGNMILPLMLWRRQRKPELLLYFYAFLANQMGALIHIAMAMGWLQHNSFTSNALQSSSLVHVLLMSGGLAMRVRQIQRGKLLAEQEAAIAGQRAVEQRRFVAMLSHEFRNPLAAIDRAAQMLQIKLPGMARPEVERLENIRANTDALSSLVDNFLVSEALDHRALALSPEPCPIRTMLESVVQNLGETVGGRVALTVTPPDAAFPLDPTLIGMAAGNLLGNALRYSPADSTVEISANADDDGLTIRVADHGPGMSEEELAMLGTPYYRASSSAGKKGSGLGYHFTRRIVEAHGGSLHASCPSGAGLEAAIFLPVAGAEVFVKPKTIETT